MISGLLGTERCHFILYLNEQFLHILNGFRVGDPNILVLVLVPKNADFSSRFGQITLLSRHGSVLKNMIW
jgi:hypothetical protein